MELIVIAGLGAVAPTHAAVIVAAVRANSLDSTVAISVGDRIDVIEFADGQRAMPQSLLDWKRIETEWLPVQGATVVGVCGARPCRRTWREAAAEISVRSDGAGALPDAHVDAAVRAAEAIEQATRASDWPSAETAYRLFAADPAYRADADAAWVHAYAARAAQLSGRPDIALQRLDLALAAAPVRSMQRAALLEERGTGLMLAGRFDAAASDLDAAIALRRSVMPTALALSVALTRRAEIYSRAGMPQPALKTIDEALALLSGRCVQCRARALAQGIRAVVLTRLDRHADALPDMRDCVSILRALDGPSAEVARRLVQVATMQRTRGEFVAAEAAIVEALQIYQSRPGSELELADAWLERGSVAHAREQRELADEHWQRALQAYRRLAPGSWREAGALNNLGFAAADRGDLDLARRQLQAALEIFQRADPGSLDTARALTNLGRLEDRAGDLDAAQRRLSAARDIQRAVNPAGRALGATLIALGAVQTRAGRLDDASATLADGSAIYEKLPKDCYCLAPVLRDIGWFELARGDATAGLRNFQRAQELFVAQQPDSVDEADAWEGIGEAQLRLGQVRAAARALDQARRVRRRDAPEHADYAQTLYALGRLAAAQGRARAAGENFCAASRVLDHAGQRVGGDTLALTLFRSQYAEIYQACFDAELRLGHPLAAFDTLERQRARSFLDALQQRGPAFAEQVRPPQGHVVDSPRWQLPAGSVLLSYSVRDNDSVLLVVDAGGVRAQPLAVGRAQLNERIEALRRLIAGHDPQQLVELQREAGQLYQLLLAPAEAAMAKADRLLISADGPLHNLPFAALWQADREQYFGAAHAFALIDSLATWNELRRHAPGIAPRHLLAVADPEPGLHAAQGESAPAASSAPAAWPEAVQLPALPAARDEVAALAQLRGSGSEILLGASATESRVTADAASADVLHFAVHALLSASRPLDSALLLRADSGLPTHAGDGLLQVWEIFQGLHLDADLVVLSACETAQGREFRGEGLLGFTRAFEYAGARAVLASLWKVQDAPTAQLMQRFYRARGASGGDARALQSAIRSMLGDRSAAAGGAERGIGRLSRVESVPATDLSHPYYWSAFQLYGGADP